MVTYHEDEQNKLLSDLKAGEEESFVRQLATDIGVPYQDLTGLSINTDALRLVDEATARKGEMAPYAMVGKALDVAVKSPTNPDAITKINELEKQGFQTTLYIVSNRSLEKAWGRYKDISASETGRGGLLDISDENLQEIVKDIHKNEDIKKRLDGIFSKKSTHQISEIMETVFGSAIALGSSDVHFEPEETFVRLRLREDGVLQEIVQFDPVLYQRLLNRVKFISGMKLTDTVTAQDGRFTIVYQGTEMEVRVAVAPGAYNESIVLRILNPAGLAVDFEKLGIEPKLFKIFEREIAKPNGMILTTGPTGSGKTTTLYSFLKKIYDPGIKIITIENPIEYHLPGITQEQTNQEKGFDFLAGLRAALRQDPDVIMVGEIRDNETATIAVNASLTGHMVFSTLHTNNAAGTIPRMLELGIQPGILAAALTVSIAQRLTRKLCTKCKKQVELPDDKKNLIRAIIKNAERIGKDMASYNITSDMAFTTYEPVGCEVCNKTGFKGRVGLYEAILTDDIIGKIMTKIPTPSEREIKQAAEHQKILTMIEDGVVKILTGVTSYDEIQGVVDLSEDVQVNVGDENANGANPNNSNSTKTGTGQLVTNNKRANSHDETSLSASAAEYSSSPSSAPNISGRGNTSFPSFQNSGEEVSLLVDYLKILENLQKENPSVGVSEKIARAGHMILSILENTPNLDQLFSSANPGVLVRDEIEGLMKELSQLEADQVKNPNVGVASEIAKIRNTIQTMRSEVAS